MINLVYPIFIRDKKNYHIAIDAINPVSAEKDINIIFVINALSPEFEQIKSLADVVIERETNNIAGAWNDGLDMLTNEDYVLFVNQDITLTPKHVEILHDQMVESRFVTWTHGHNSFSCFGGQVSSFNKVGRFDESYIRYHEDNDYHYRMRLKGYDLYSCGLKLYHVGSSVIKHDKEAKQSNNTTFQRGKAYYNKKWGGYVGQERFKTPFNE